MASEVLADSCSWWFSVFISVVTMYLIVNNSLGTVTPLRPGLKLVSSTEDPSFPFQLREIF